MLLVVVGDISRERLEKAITSTLGTLPRGNYTWTLPQPWTAKGPRVATVQRRLPTNYVFGTFSGPQQSSPDFPAFRIATSYIGGLISDFVRSEGLSYSAGATTLDYGATSGAIWVSTLRPDTVVKIINLAIDVMQSESVPRAAMLRASKRYINGYYYQSESNAEQAGMLAEAQLYYGNFRAAAEYAEVLKKVTGGDVRRAAREYVKNIQYGFVGDTIKVPMKTMMKQP
jgi:predicted Zn-dependent peptidase